MNWPKILMIFKSPSNEMAAKIHTKLEDGINMLLSKLQNMCSGFPNIRISTLESCIYLHATFATRKLVCNELCISTNHLRLFLRFELLDWCNDADTLRPFILKTTNFARPQLHSAFIVPGSCVRKLTSIV